jgi:hypothetical protein
MGHATRSLTHLELMYLLLFQLFFLSFLAIPALFLVTVPET